MPPIPPWSLPQSKWNPSTFTSYSAAFSTLLTGISGTALGKCVSMISSLRQFGTRRPFISPAVSATTLPRLPVSLFVPLLPLPARSRGALNEGFRLPVLDAHVPRTGGDDAEVRVTGMELYLAGKQVIEADHAIFGLYRHGEVEGITAGVQAVARDRRVRL